LSRLVTDAKRVHGRLVELKRQKNTINAELALLLAQVDREKLYRAFVRTSTADYAVHYGFVRSSRKARELVAMVEDLEAAPRIRAGFEKGEFEWTKVRTAAAAVAARPASEGVWLERLRSDLTCSELENEAREEKGDPAPVRWSLQLTVEEAADLEQALAAARATYGRKLTDAQALAIVCRS
jgi:hypothetical protein